MANSAKSSRPSSEPRVRAPKDRQYSSSSWKDSWHGKPSNRSSSTGRVGQSTSGKAKRSGEQKSKKALHMPIQPPPDLSAQQFPDLKASLTGELPQRKNKLVLPRAASNSRTRSSSSTRIQKEEERKAKHGMFEEIAKLKASATELGERLAQAPSSEVGGGDKDMVDSLPTADSPTNTTDPQDAVFMERVDIDDGPSTYAAVEDTLPYTQESISTEADKVEVPPSSQPVLQLEADGGDKDVFDSLATAGSPTDKTDPQDAVCMESVDVDNAPSTQAAVEDMLPDTQESVPIETNNVEVVETIEDANEHDVAEAEMNACKLSYDVGDADRPKQESIEAGASTDTSTAEISGTVDVEVCERPHVDDDADMLKQAMHEAVISTEDSTLDKPHTVADVDARETPATQTSDCRASDAREDAEVCEQAAEHSAEDFAGMSVSQRKALFMKKLAGSGFEGAHPKKEVAQQRHAFVPVKRITSGSSADSYLDRLERDKEIQRINCCRAAAAVLDLPQSALQDRHAVTIAYLSKAWLLYSFPIDGEDVNDTERAISLLTGAYKHCIMGVPWRHGFRDESEDAEEDAFDMFSRVAQAAIDGGEIECELVPSFQAVLNRPRE